MHLIALLCGSRRWRKFGHFFVLFITVIHIFQNNGLKMSCVWVFTEEFMCTWTKTAAYRYNIVQWTLYFMNNKSDLTTSTVPLQCCGFGSVNFLVSQIRHNLYWSRSFRHHVKVRKHCFFTFYLWRLMLLYLQKVISNNSETSWKPLKKRLGSEPKSRIRKSVARIRRTVLVAKCHGSVTL